MPLNKRVVRATPPEVRPEAGVIFSGPPGEVLLKTSAMQMSRGKRGEGRSGRERRTRKVEGKEEEDEELN